MTSNKRLWVIVSLVFIVCLFFVISTPQTGIVKVVEEQMEELERPDIYNPARAAITNARMYFSERESVTGKRHWPSAATRADNNEPRASSRTGL